MQKRETKIIKLGEVGVDSGQLMICDPVYLEGEYQHPDSGDKDDHAHTVYKHVEDGSLWQYCYTGKNPSLERVNRFPGTYEMIIQEYRKTPNQLIQEGTFVKADLDPTPHIPEGEFSYRGICKATLKDDQYGGQLNFKLGHAGAAVAFRSGFGDGVYEVFAEVVNYDVMGWRLRKVWVELVNEDEDNAG